MLSSQSKTIPGLREQAASPVVISLVEEKQSNPSLSHSKRRPFLWWQRSCCRGRGAGFGKLALVSHICTWGFAGHPALGQPYVMDGSRPEAAAASCITSLKLPSLPSPGFHQPGLEGQETYNRETRGLCFHGSPILLPASSFTVWNIKCSGRLWYFPANAEIEKKNLLIARNQNVELCSLPSRESADFWSVLVTARSVSLWICLWYKM